MPFNNTGKPNQAFNSIPAGCLYLAELDSNDYPTSLRDMMAVPSFEGAPEQTFADAYSTCGEQRVLEDRASTQTDLTISLTVRSINDVLFQNLVHSGTLDRGTLGDGTPIATVVPGYALAFADPVGTDPGDWRVPNPLYAHTNPAGMALGYDDHDFANRRYHIWVDGSGADRELRAGGDVGYNTAKHAYQVDGTLLFAQMGANGGPATRYFADRTETGALDAGGAFTSSNTEAATNFEVVEHAGQIFLNNSGSLARDILIECQAGGAFENQAFAKIQIGTTQANSSSLLPQMTRIKALTRNQRSFMAILVQQDRRRSGLRRVWTFPKVTFFPSGNWTAISDDTEFATQDVEMVVQKPSYATSDDAFYYIDTTARGLDN